MAPTEEANGNWTVTVTNKHEPELVDIFGEKVWDDADDQDGIRPESIEITLLADGEPVTVDGNGNTVENPITVTADENGEFKWDFKDLPRFKNVTNADGSVTHGVEIEYSFSEAAITYPDDFEEGYATSYTYPEFHPPVKDAEGKVTEAAYWYIEITNSYTPRKTSVPVRKVWRDAGNQDGIRPKSIKVQLYADGVAFGDPVTLSEDNDWKYTWIDLDERKAGKIIEYTVKETRVPYGYYLEGIVGNALDGYVIINRHIPEETEATVKKVWDDSNNRYKKRPASLTVTLSDGTRVVLNEGNNWTATVRHLPKFHYGMEISYTWTEEGLPEGYKLTSVETVGTITTLTNSYDNPPPPPELPKTGQLLWPILLLALAGILLVVFGCFMCRRATGKK